MDILHTVFEYFQKYFGASIHSSYEESFTARILVYMKLKTT